MTDTEQTLSEQLSVARNEAEALVWYFARHWIHDADASDEAAEAYATLVKALSDSQNKDEESNYRELMISYQKLANFTFAKHKVHGRSILDTTRKTSYRTIFSDKRRQPVIFGLIFLSFALFFQALDIWTELSPGTATTEQSIGAAVAGVDNDASGGVLGGIPEVEPEEDAQPRDEANLTSEPEFGLVAVLAAVLPLLVPATWGALGACTALAKRVSDRLSAMSFEENRMQALSSRIFLGAALALVLDILVFVEGNSTPENGLELGFGPIAGAFLAGLFVQHIYGCV